LAFRKIKKYDKKNAKNAAKMSHQSKVNFKENNCTISEKSIKPKTKQVKYLIFIPCHLYQIKSDEQRE
jgi:hypothetical protein